MGQLTHPKPTAKDLTAELAKPFEGLELEAYFDPVGYPTQGYGRLLSREAWGPAGQPPKTSEQKKALKDWLNAKYPPITEDVAEEWLEEDMDKAYRSVLRLCPGAQTPHQVAALTDFAYNCGAGNLEISRLRKMVNRQDDLAAEEFGKWVYARGVKLAGLVRRRNAEKQMYMG